MRTPRLDFRTDCERGQHGPTVEQTVPTQSQDCVNVNVTCTRCGLRIETISTRVLEKP